MVPIKSEMLGVTLTEAPVSTTTGRCESSAECRMYGWPVIVENFDVSAALKVDLKSAAATNTYL
jgi:hypothetical protein